MCLTKDQAETLVRAVFDRAGTPVPAEPEALEERLARIADDGAAQYRHAIEDGDGPLDTAGALLAVTDALREVLGYSRTPVNAEVFLG